MRAINHLASPILAFALFTGAVERVHSQAVDPAKALAALQEKVLSKGPNGEEPWPASSVSLTEEEMERIRGLKAKAAIVMHYCEVIGHRRRLPVSNRSLTKWESK